ncbi:hypothetical protein GCM10010507_55940 [Streptomyces cinnamoneus]|uniref:DUF397 domain-containing protein n=1 Tax=Streptomyces cinnamoneus TaxID=53446 RepID=A0A918U070_STRCJ|nr:hypothetical protein GCM10010507_55940 [Streptomyces cinnamoneus]
MAVWQKSSYCSEGNACLNVAAAGNGTVRLRESEAPGAVLTLKRAALHGLIRALKAEGNRNRP